MHLWQMQADFFILKTHSASSAEVSAPLYYIDLLMKAALMLI